MWLVHRHSVSRSKLNNVNKFIQGQEILSFSVQSIGENVQYTVDMNVRTPKEYLSVGSEKRSYELTKEGCSKVTFRIGSLLHKVYSCRNTLNLVGITGWPTHATIMVLVRYAVKVS